MEYLIKSAHGPEIGRGYRAVHGEEIYPRKRPLHRIAAEPREIPLPHVSEWLVIAITPDDFLRPECVKRLRHPLLLPERVVAVAVSHHRAPGRALGVHGNVTAYQARAGQRTGVQENQDRIGGQRRSGIPGGARPES